MRPSFSGFPEDLFRFLEELTDNNNREWFNDHRERYRAVVVEPVADFIEAMAPRLRQISARYVADPRPRGGSMFRIHRDVRFSKDKRPYKQNVGCQFRHEAARDAHAPGFYVHIAADEIFFGGGIWRPPHDVLGSIRDAIVEQPERWHRITTSRAFVKRFGGIHGDGLKRPPAGYDAAHPHVADLKRKTFFAMQPVTRELAMSPRFVTEVTRAFKDAGPLMAFLTTSVGLPY